VDWKNTTPKLVTITSDGFIEIGIEKPGMPVFMSVEVPRRYFEKTGKYVYKITDDLEDPFRRGKTLWEVAMQCRNVEEVRVFTDDLESGLFLAANFQNDPTFPFLFAKLLEECELHSRVMKLFEQYAGRF
jgi:hypothetical protein